MIERSQHSRFERAVASAVGAAVLVCGLFFAVDAFTLQLAFQDASVAIGMAVLGACALALGTTNTSVQWAARSILLLVVVVSVLSLLSMMPMELAVVKSVSVEWEDTFLRPDVWLGAGALSLALSHWRWSWPLPVLILLAFSGGASVVAYEHVFPATAGANALLLVPATIGALAAWCTATLAQRETGSGLALLLVAPVGVFFGESLLRDPTARVFVLSGVPAVLLVAFALVTWRKNGATTKQIESTRLERIAAIRSQAELEEVSGTGSWKYIEDGKRISLSPQASSLLLCEEEVPVDRVASLFDDLTIEDWIEEGTRTNGRRSIVASATIDGGVRWIEIVAQRVFTNGDSELRGTFRDVTAEQVERKEYMHRLALLETLAERVPDIDFVYDIHSARYTYCNKPIGELVGSKTDDSGLVLENAVIEEDRDVLLAHIQRVNRMPGQESDSAEFRVRNGAGDVRWIRSRASVFERDDVGNPVTVFGTYQDITEHKAVLQKLEESEARYGRIAAKCPGVIFQFAIAKDGTFHFPYVSPSVLELIGVTSQAIMENAEAAFSLVHEDDVVTLMSLIEDARKNVTDLSWLGRVVRDSGQTTWVHVTARPSVHDDGTIVWDGVALDLTDLKTAQLELEVTQKRLDALMTESPAVPYSCEPQPPYRLQTVAPNIRFVLGLIPDQLVGRPLFGVDFVHPNDVEEYRAHERRFIDHGRSKCEFRMRALSGEYVWLRDDVRIVNGEGGSVEVAGVWTEVGELHNAVTTARESEDRFLRLASQTPGMVVELVLHDQVRPELRFVSHGSYDLLGVPPDELRARPELLLKMIDDADKPTLYRELVRSEADLSDVRWEGTVTTANNGMKRVSFRARPYRGGESIVWIGSFMPIANAEVVRAVVTPHVDVPLEMMEPPSDTATQEELSILVIAPESEAERLLALELRRWERADVRLASTAGHGLEQSKRLIPDIIVIVDKLPDMSPTAVLEVMREDEDLARIPVVVFDKDLSSASQGRLLKAGATTVVASDPSVEEIKSAVDEVLAGR